MISDLILAVFVVAVIYILVRPGSQGTAFVSAFGNFLSGLISQATDLAGAASNDRSTSGN